MCGGECYNFAIAFCWIQNLLVRGPNWGAYEGGGSGHSYPAGDDDEAKDVNPEAFYYRSFSSPGFYNS